MPNTKNTSYFWDLGLQTLKELETEEGILASSREEAYGCIFGRDTLITCLKLLRVYKKTRDVSLLFIVRKALVTLAQLQGRTINLESGEQPGKCIHEYRPSNHEHLTADLPRPWYVYEDRRMRNYDSVDATPLMLIAFYRYQQYADDGDFLVQMLPHIEAALSWCFNYGDSNGDGLIDYQLPPDRKAGGLITQNWMDSVESVFHETEGELVYPMAPVEVQAYTYLAYRLWAKFFGQRHREKSAELNRRADELRRLFNQKYPTEDPEGNKYLAWKIDGTGTPFRSVRSNMGHVLWASTNKYDDGEIDCILDREYIPAVVARLMMPDMFEPNAGIRTLSVLSRKFMPNSYHNGSIWPHDNGMIAEGFEIHGFLKEAEQVRTAMLSAVGYFGTPIELFVYMNGYYSDYCSDEGQMSCKKQAWSAASILEAAALAGA
jgi:glycogen debranching enzyme